MDYHGLACISRGLTWIIVDQYELVCIDWRGLAWMSVIADSHGLSWISVDQRGLVVLWMIMDYRELEWTNMDQHGLACIVHGLT